MTLRILGITRLNRRVESAGTELEWTNFRLWFISSLAVSKNQQKKANHY